MESNPKSGPARTLNTLMFLLMLLILPGVTWYATISVRYYGGALRWPDAEMLSHIAPPSLSSVVFYLGWLVLQVGLAAFLPGRSERGVPLEGGATLSYRMNGLWAHVLTLAGAAALVFTGVVPATFLHDQLDALVTTTNIVVLTLCFVLYAIGRRQATAAELERNPIEAYFVGAALNPRTRSFDWKFFCESRPGMILWVLINASLASAQLARHGSISTGMWLVCAFQLLYVTDYFVHEEAILTTWDIRHEPFGFMLCWGSLVWVPFTFSLQALYLVDHATALSPLAAAAITLFNLAGYVIFRGANLQKHRFRRDPSQRIWGKPAVFIETRHGGKLLASGFWGLSRHSNYLGDLMMGLSWCLATGAHTVLPYFYFIYFVILLVHRERRDNDHCARKYGEDWQRYTRKVPWRIVPFVY